MQWLRTLFGIPDAPPKPAEHRWQIDGVIDGDSIRNVRIVCLDCDVEMTGLVAQYMKLAFASGFLAGVTSTKQHGSGPVTNLPPIHPMRES